ncbi:NUDIX hydrolase [Alteribacter natronophilus]|uniref:NUDIX hydrolase n=1 Tax=Alteribacter natronophilus TaxID=2583810 RepID=UPI00110E17CB|nr:NUDIX hydrolase [Alteribacter natronophilus]TMW72853.1 NUDIX hydrolase [Alteribacter natronophilus]
MKKWSGAAGICINEKGELLMVLQGKPEEEKRWTIPSGGIEKGETFEECCVRELWEETGYHVQVTEKINVKQGYQKEYGLSVEVHYFSVRLTGGEKVIQDPDGLIYAIDWKNIEGINNLILSFPEDREFLINFIQNSQMMQEENVHKQKLK